MSYRMLSVGWGWTAVSFRRDHMSITNFRNAFLVLLVLAMSVAFIAMIRELIEERQGGQTAEGGGGELHED